MHSPQPQFNHVSPTKAWQSLRRSHVCTDILEADGAHVRFAVRAKVVLFPEDVVAVWLMVAVQYAAAPGAGPN